MVEGSPVAKPTDPDYLGYRFDGWFVEGNESVAYEFTTSVNSNLTLKAKWSPRDNTVTFDVGSGTGGPSSQIVTTEKKVTRPDSNPTRDDGYLFAGWFKEDSFEYYDFSAPVNRDLTIVAMWTDPNYLEFTSTTEGYSVKQRSDVPSGRLVIPATYNERPVVAIEDQAFMSNTHMTAIAIPASVESIGSGVFEGCTFLSAVTFEPGSKLSEIKQDAFYTPFSFPLTSIEIPANVKTIGENAFGNCQSLSTITFGSGSILSTIEKGAFGITAIESIEIPASVKTMGSNVFSGCDNLQTIYIGTAEIPTEWDPDWKAGCNAKVINSNGQTVYFKYTVTFDSNGGQFSGATTVQVENGKKLTEPEEPT